MARSRGKNNSVKTFTCIGCGTVVSLRRQSGSTKYCSSKCFGKHKLSRKRQGETVSCAQCHLDFYLAQYRIKKDNFCSKNCANLWQGRNKVEKTCIVCGTIFRLSPSWPTFHAGLYCSTKCRHESPLERRRMLEMNIKQQAEKNPNKLEVAGEKILNDLHISFIPQVLIADKFLVDAFIPILGIVIQWDGDYWHGYGVPEGQKHPEMRIRKRMRLDRSQDAYMKECGYTVLRFWEHEVFDQPKKVSRRIRATI